MSAWAGVTCAPVKPPGTLGAAASPAATFLGTSQVVVTVQPGEYTVMSIIVSVGKRMPGTAGGFGFGFVGSCAC